jgi:hypothetical protein
VVLWVGGDLLGFGFSDMAFEGPVDVGDAVVDIIGRALGDHLDSAVRKIADAAGQVVAPGDIVNCEAESDALDPAYKDYTFCGLAHFSYCVYRIAYCVLRITAVRILY